MLMVIIPKIYRNRSIRAHLKDPLLASHGQMIEQIQQLCVTYIHVYSRLESPNMMINVLSSSIPICANIYIYLVIS